MLSINPDKSSRQRLLLTALIVTLVSIVSGCGSSERSDMVDALAAALDNDTFLALTPETRTCMAEELVDGVGLETLAEAEITSENVASRLDDGSFFVYLSGLETSDITLGCMNEEELAGVAALDFSLSDEVASCVVDKLGEDDTRDSMIESLRSGDTGEEWGEAVTGCDEEAAGPATESVRETTSVPTTTPPEPTLPSFADSMPAYLASEEFRNARIWGAQWNGYRATGYRPPLAFFENAATDRGSLIETGSAETASIDPTGQLVARYYQATAVERERLTFTSIRSGEDKETIEFDSGGDGVSDLQWSPDGRALVFRLGRSATWVLHRVGSGSVTFEGRSSQFAFASSGSMTTLMSCGFQGGLVNVTEAGTVINTERSGCSAMAQAIDGDGSPFIVMADNEGNIDRIDTGSTTPVTTNVGSDGRSLISCDGSVVKRDLRGNAGLLATASRANFVSVPLDQQAGCPVPSPDGSAVAYTTTSGTVEVLIPSTGARTEVALSGVPLSFDASGDRLLVYGGGLFVVAVDGSGGTEASVPVSSQPNMQSSFCRIGNTGLGLLTKDGFVGLFDVAANEFTQLTVGSLGPSCRISADENWVIANGLVINVPEGEAATLHATDLANGNRVLANTRTEGQRTASYRWAGPSTEIATFDFR